jgi:hypothetical protein
MKRKSFTEEQIIAGLREHDVGAKSADLARKHDISEAQTVEQFETSGAASRCGEVAVVQTYRPLARPS